MDREGNLLSVGDIPLPSEIDTPKSVGNKNSGGMELAGVDLKKANEKEKLKGKAPCSSKTEMDNKKQISKPLSALEMLKKTYDEELGSSEEEDLLRSESDDESNEKKVSKVGPGKDAVVLDKSVIEMNATELNYENVLTSLEPDNKTKVEKSVVQIADSTSDVKNYEDSLKNQTQKVSSSDKSNLSDTKKSSLSTSKIEEHISESSNKSGTSKMESSSAAEASTLGKGLSPKTNNDKIGPTDVSTKTGCEESSVVGAEKSKLGSEISSVTKKSLSENINKEINLTSVDSNLQKDCGNSSLVLSPPGMEKKSPSTASDSSKPTNVLLTSTASTSESDKIIRLEDIPIPSEPMKSSSTFLKEDNKSIGTKLIVSEPDELINIELPPEPVDKKKCDPSKVISQIAESFSKSEEKKIMSENPQNKAFTCPPSNQKSGESIKDSVEHNKVNQTETNQDSVSDQENKKDVHASPTLSTSLLCEDKNKSDSNVSKHVVSSDIKKTELELQKDVKKVVKHDELFQTDSTTNILKKQDGKVDSNREQVISSGNSVSEAQSSLTVSSDGHTDPAENIDSRQTVESVQVTKPVVGIVKSIPELSKSEMKLSDDSFRGSVEKNLVRANDKSSDVKDILKRTDTIKCTDSSLKLPSTELASDSCEKLTKFEKDSENTSSTFVSQELQFNSDNKDLDNSESKVPIISKEVCSKGLLEVSVEQKPVPEESTSRVVKYLDNVPQDNEKDLKLPLIMPTDSKNIDEKSVKEIPCGKESTEISKMIDKSSMGSEVKVADLHDNKQKSTLISKELEQEKIRSKEFTKHADNADLKDFEVISTNAAQVDNISIQKTDVHETSASSNLEGDASLINKNLDLVVTAEKEPLKQKINENNKTHETFPKKKTQEAACKQTLEMPEVFNKPVGEIVKISEVPSKAEVESQEVKCTSDTNKSNILPVHTEDSNVSNRSVSASESKTLTEKKDVSEELAKIKNQDDVKSITDKFIVENIDGISEKQSEETSLQSTSKKSSITLERTTISSKDSDKTETPKAVIKDILVTEKLDVNEKNLEEKSPSTTGSSSKSTNSKVCEVSPMNLPLDKSNKNSTKIGNPTSLSKLESIADTNSQHSDSVSSENESCDSSSMPKGKESPEPTRRVKLIRPVFTPKPLPDLIKQKPSETESSSSKQRSVVVSTVAKQSSELKGTDEPDFCKLSTVDKTECIKVTKKEDLEKQSSEPIKLTRSVKKSLQTETVELPFSNKLLQKSIEKQEPDNVDEKSTTELIVEKLDKEVKENTTNLIHDPISTEPSGNLKEFSETRSANLRLEQSVQAKAAETSEKILVKEESKPASEICKTISETGSARPPLKSETAKEHQDSVIAKGDSENYTVKTPDSPKRVRLVRPVTRKPAEKAIVSQSSVAVSVPPSTTTDSKMLRERLEEKPDSSSKPVKRKSDDSNQMPIVKHSSETKDDKNESSQPQSKAAVINVTDMQQTSSSSNIPKIATDQKSIKSEKVSINEVQEKEEVDKKLAEEETQLLDTTKKKEIDSQVKQLEYTLKIGKASTIMIPKEEKSVPKIDQDTPEKSCLSNKEKPKKVRDILEDPDVTITPIAAESSKASRAAAADAKNVVESEDDDEDEDDDDDDDKSWKHLGDNKVIPVGDKVGRKSDDLVETRKEVTKVEEQDSAILTTSSGVKINLQKTPPKVLNALISEAQASSSSDDVQFVKVIPADPDEPTTDPLAIPHVKPHIKREVIPVNTEPPKRRRGRPRKIPLEPRQMMEHMQMAAGHHGDGEYTSGLFPVPLFDMSETMFTTPSGHHTLFPEQIVPNSNNRPQRTCRGRVKLPSVRTRKPRGSSISGRVSSSGRGRGRGYKRKFTEDENIITIDNVEQEMMRNQMAGRRRLSAGSKMDDDEEEDINVDAIKREPESEEDKNLTKAERTLRKKEEKKLRMLEKKRMKQEAREKEKAAAIEAALAEEETRMSAPEGSNKDGHEGLYSSFSERGEKRKSDSGITEGEGGETPTPTKRRKEQYRCCICLEETPLRKLTSPLDHRSWTVLYEAAIVRQFEPILKLTDDITREIPPTVLYHRNCRSEFTHKKTLAKLTETTVGELNDQLNAEQAIPSNSKEFTVDQIAEYQWPLQGGDLFMIQEQISTYLGVKSFKRKYPDIKRRAVEMEERQWLCDNGLVSESLCDLGLTAVSSAEVLDVMFADFPEKYEEFRKHIREKQARELSSKQKAALCSLLDKKKLEQSKLQTDSKQEAIQSAANWNCNLNKMRGEQRRCSLDLQSLIIHYPKTKGLKMIPPNQLPRRVGHYPVALIPGQFCDFYKSYTPDELRYYPLDTVLYGPMKPNERLCGGGGGSDGSQTDSDDSSSSDDSSDTSSEGTQDTEGTCEEDEKEREKEKQMDEAHCKVCGGDKTRNKQDQPEVMIHCAQCTKSCHPTCIGLTVVMVPHIRRYDWQCTDCKTCIQCKDPADEDKMLFCDLCDRGYHIYCVGLRKVPIGRWHCQVCSVCNSCGTTDPGGPDWQHEYKKGEKNSRIYIQTLCGACSKLWRKGRYCQICLRCYNMKPEEESELVQCTACDRWMHTECCRTTGSTIHGNSGILCEACQERAMPKAVQRVIRP